jgi:hypothetical protein
MPVTAPEGSLRHGAAIWCGDSLGHSIGATNMETEKLDDSRFFLVRFAQTKMFFAIVGLVFGSNIGLTIANATNLARFESLNARLDALKTQLETTHRK